MSIELQTFKAGDEVYCPHIGFKIYKLEASVSDCYPIYISCIGFDSSGRLFIPDYTGMKKTHTTTTAIFHATPENKAKLEALYGVEFEAPKLTGSDLTRKLLSEGKHVLCYVSDVSEACAIEKKGIRSIFDYCGNVDCFKTSLPNGSFQYWKYAVPCNYYANLVDGVLLLNGENNGSL